MTNRLAHETSPYLLQHQHNPVDWFPWGPEALAKAAAADRPILLSVGYSACHWCHVMERESFEDEATAAIMNEHFVCIKVDREERPDLDEIYMRAVQAFSGGHGGWPMTVFLTPQGVPFFAGTYFPPQPRHGMPSFPQVLKHAAHLYRADKDQLARVTGEIRRYLDSAGRLPAPAAEAGAGWLSAVAQAAAQDFDEARGGFGGAPKFPPHGSLAVLLAHHVQSGDPHSLHMLTRTLDAMAQGGMYDLLRGGFCRYSVDADWRIPHFEKMLYDNAQLLPLYTDAWVLTGSPLYARVVEETVAFVLRELQDPRGGFWSALDADSEGEEGRFYAWTPAALEAALAGSDLDAARLCALLEVDAIGSFEHGSSVLRLSRPLEALAPPDRALVEAALPRLRAAQDARVRPGLDDKVLAGWTALMVSGLARAAATFQRPDWHAAAARAAAFLLEEQTVDGRLMRTWKAGPQGDGRARIPAYADDHAFLVAALLDLYEADFDPSWLRDALALAEWTLQLFWDPAQGGLFYTGRDAEPLITRSKHMMGGAEPSANGVMALALVRLAAFCDRADLREKAETIARCYRPLLEQAPRALGPEALAGAWLEQGGLEIGLVGSPEGADTEALVQALRRRVLPFSVRALVPPDAGPELLSLLPWMKERVGPRARATAFVCQGFSCQLPVQGPEALLAQLDGMRTEAGPVDRGRHREPAPALPLDPDAWLNSEGPMGLDTLRGAVVVLDFWTYCCVNCMHLLPVLAAVEERFKDQPVQVIGVHSAKFPAEKELANVRRALRRHQVGHPVVHDPEHRVWQDYEVESWPTLVVLDARGRIAWRQSGEIGLEELGAVVARLLDEARQEGSLEARPRPLLATTLDDTELDHPGKVHVWPDARLQALGRPLFDEETRLYIADTGHHRIVEASLRLGLDGWPRAEILREFGSGEPGLLDARAPLARFRQPQGLCRSGANLWVADTGNHALRRVDLDSGRVETAAGTGQLGQGPAHGPRPPRQTDLRSPWDVTVGDRDPSDPDAPDVVLIAMAGSHQIWVYMQGEDALGPFVGSGREDHVDGPPQDAALAQPSALVAFGPYLFFADAETSSVRAFDMAERKVGTVVGRGLFDFGDIDGPPDRARLQHPLGLDLADGELYVADSFNGKIKRISLNGGITRTVAGGAGLLSEPGGIAVAGDFLIVADTNHHELKVVHRKTGELRALPLGR